MVEGRENQKLSFSKQTLEKWIVIRDVAIDLLRDVCCIQGRQRWRGFRRARTAAPYAPTQILNSRIYTSLWCMFFKTVCRVLVLVLPFAFDAEFSFAHIYACASADWHISTCYPIAVS